ncbi:MAG TPA: hypothetical protein VKM56_14530 [Verrucomicrobiae bacterium]|nr:hypothetical protein [Verrucomicrobiae bacterium]
MPASHTASFAKAPVKKRANPRIEKPVLTVGEKGALARTPVARNTVDSTNTKIAIRNRRQPLATIEAAAGA